MKKIILSMAVAALALGATAGDCAATCCGGEPAWKSTLAKVKDMWPDTGICSFMKKEAPAYITGNYAEADRIRAEVLEKGYVIEDTPKGPKVKKA